MSALRLATRPSPLALAQSAAVARLIHSRTGRDVELVTVSTVGDRSSAPLEQIGGTGVFTSAVRDELIAGRVDLAVHSLKDLPTAAAPGLAVAAIPTRADARDVLVCAGGRSLADLPDGARVGTGSPRRAAQLRHIRPELTVVGIRGNVGTRLARLAGDQPLDAIVLAAAGLDRLGGELALPDGANVDVLDPSVMIPAPGQGALAVECRSDDLSTVLALTPLDDAATRAAVTAERAALAALEAGCSAPVGVHAVVESDHLDLRGVVAAADGSRVVTHRISGTVDDAVRIGRALADELLAAGAAELMGSAV